MKYVDTEITTLDPRCIDRRRKFNFSLFWPLYGKEEALNKEIFVDLGHALGHDRVPMVLTRSEEHARWLHNTTEERIGSCGLITGRVNWTLRRDELLHNKVVVATLGAGAEGLNRLEIDEVLLAMPLGKDGENKFLQSIFRSLRDVPGKPKPVVICYIPKFGPGYAMARRMEEYAQRAGWEVESAQGGLGGLSKVQVVRGPEHSRVRSRLGDPESGIRRGRAGGE
jgi:hypothetical protein